MALSPFALTTVANVKAELPTLSGAGEDTFLEDAINAVSFTFEQETNRRLKVRTYRPTGASSSEANLKLNGRDRQSPTRFYFPEWPLNSITSVVIRDSRLTIIKTLEIATDLIVEPELGEMVLIDGDIWEPGVQNIDVVLSAGYATVPFDLERAASKQAAEEFHARDRAKTGVESISFGGESVRYITGPLLKDVKQLLLHYKKNLSA